MKAHIFLIISLLASLLQGVIIHESGSLKEFIGGSEPNAAYDNFVSHVSEGIASDGYNDYGPDWLDVQTDGFGDYRILSSGSEALNHWRDIFDALISGDIDGADDMLSDSLSTFYYELVDFTDDSTQRQYYIIREQLDLSYVDEGLPEIMTDTVTGSFRNGWGLFILSPNAARQHVVIEAPHPCDDFISVYQAAEMFIQLDAFALMVAGAGREVKWTEEGSYSNNKSLSDPARNSNTVFHTYHKALCDTLINIGPHSPLVFHVHSFDDNASHEGYRSIVMSGGWDAGYANKPIRDVTDDHLDIINFTSEVVHESNTFGEHEPEGITDFYQVHYEGEFYYYGESQNYSLPHTYYLLGPNTGVQMNYLRSFFDNRSVYEPWVQIEHHEKPVMFDDMGMELTELYGGEYPTSYHNFHILSEYYQPLIDAMQAYLTHWESVPDMTPPPQISDIHSTYDGYHYVALEWEPVEDTNFKTYRIYYAPGEVDETAPYWDINDDDDLLDMRVTETMIHLLDQELQYNFRIQGIDHFDNAGLLSDPATDFIPGHDPHIVLENFDDGELTLSSYSDQDEDPNDWDLSSAQTFMETPYSLRIWGNSWKTQEIEPHPVSDGDVWQISLYTSTQGEIHGFGIQDSVNTLLYSFDGSQELDIENWVTVYQGYRPIHNWNIFRLPIADDWFAYFDYYPSVTSLVYINDRDNDSNSIVYFDEVVDISPVLHISPDVTIDYSVGGLYRNQIGQRSVDVQFFSMVEDPDSDDHDYYWNFGDGETSSEANPYHTFIVEDDHPYSVLLQVQDESGYWGYATTQIAVDPGETSLPVTMNFIGDIMLARSYEDDGGIIETQGVEAIFEPTLPLLGAAADVTIANLECPLTYTGTPHPTKSVVFKGSPENVDGLVHAGIDIVTLANNHSVDYGLEGLINTQNTLANAGILYSGAGENSYEAYLPLYYNVKGINVAFLANCDRTGQYNNAQPYLNAGANKDGFAYMTPYYLREQIEAVQGEADFIIMEMHAGSEYSTGPGAEYDAAFNIDWDNPQDIIAPREDISEMDLPDISDEDENYSPRLDVPHMWDREIRHFAVDSGADLLIIHHPHIVQGFEVYNGKLIAHSLGNYIFDLSYHETFPSVVLNTKLDTTGFYEFSAVPTYIDDWIPVRAEGQLGLHLLDYIAHKSRELDTYFYVDRDSVIGYVIMDTLNMPSVEVTHRNMLPLNYVNSHWTSEPFPIHQNGNVSSIEPPVMPGNWEFRAGREMIWYGNMEDEGSTEWNTNSNDEWLDDETAFEGDRSITHRRFPNSGDNIVTNLEARVKIDSDLDYGVGGWIKTVNGDDVTIEIRYYSSRTSSNYLAQHDIDIHIDGDTDWTYYYGDANPPSNAKYFDIRLNSDMPSAGEARSWFDNVGVVEWTDWTSFDEADYIFNPNHYYYLQVRNSGTIFETELFHKETVYEEAEPVTPDFTASETTALAPALIEFTNTSSGYTGWFEWDFGDGETSIEENPVHLYSQIGTFDVTFRVMDYEGNILEESRPGYIQTIPEFLPGDVNFDNVQNILDIIQIVTIIIGDWQDPPDEVLQAADTNFDGNVNVLDVIVLVNIIVNM